MYVRTGDLDGFGDLGAWYDSVTIDRQILGDWARRLDPSLPADNNAVIARIAQTIEQGGGFVAGNVRMCPSNRRGGPTEPMRTADQPCPPGSGGMPGEQVKEISAEEVRQQIEEQMRREAEEREYQRTHGGQSRAVEIYGIVADGQGTPVPGASVAVGTMTATTDAAGGFSVVGLPGAYTIDVRATGFLSRRVEGVLVPAGRPFDAGTIVVIRQAAAGGTGDKFKSGDGTTPWYKNKWLWIGTGVVVVGGVAVYAVSRRRSR